ncbi:MAG: ribonuclease III [Roseburia sp.]|nr:ribonuclease III [Roseburia sp.]
MGQGINAYIMEQFGIEAVDIRSYSPLTLAYIGDEVFDLVIRSLVVGRGNTRPNKLHQRTSRIVRASTQAQIAEFLLPELTGEEADIYRRGRNANSPTMAKNATVADYRRATGLEALVGYLYLTDRFERLLELIKKAVSGLGLKL